MEQITDHPQRAISRLAEQLRGKPKLEGFIATKANRTQAIEDAMWQLIVLRSVETASGAQLDMLGRIVGQPRNALNDDIYRLHIKAKIRLNATSGTMEEILSIFSLLIPDATLSIIEYFPASFVLRISDFLMPEEQATFMNSFLQRAKAGGVRAILEYFLSEDEDSFSFADGPGAGFGDATDPDVGGNLSGAL